MALSSSPVVYYSINNSSIIPPSFPLSANRKFSPIPIKKHKQRLLGISASVKSSEREEDSDYIVPPPPLEEEVDNVGVRAALSILKFYKGEISPLLPKSCRYVPTCSEYSMISYKKYGFVKGTILTAWRICRCNPLGGSGFDPPRWFGEADTLD